MADWILTTKAYVWFYWEPKSSRFYYQAAATCGDGWDASKTSHEPNEDGVPDHKHLGRFATLDDARNACEADHKNSQ